MNKIFGANWRTSMWGNICVIASAIALAPKIVAFLPDNIEGYVTGVAGLIAVVSGSRAFSNSKDKQVTGGLVQQTATGAEAEVSAASTSVVETTEAKPTEGNSK